MKLHIGRINDKEFWVKLQHYRKEDIQQLRSTVPGGSWDAEAQFWRYPFSKDRIRQLYAWYPEELIVPSEDILCDSRFMEARGEENATEEMRTLYFDSDVSELGHKMIDVLKAKGYSYKTIKAYRGHVRRFFERGVEVASERMPTAGALEEYGRLHSIANNGECDRVSPAGSPKDSMDISLKRSHVQEYALQLLGQGYSHTYVNQVISALRFLATSVLQRPSGQAPYLRPKKEKKLPYVLSEQEVVRILRAPDNLKHRTMLYLAYSSGLRVSEVVRLKISDLDWERGTISMTRERKKRPSHLTVKSRVAACSAIHSTREAVHLAIPWAKSPNASA
jgi:hypothetical protein